MKTIDLLAAAPCRAFWTPPIDGETGFPTQRIIHTRVLQLPVPARLKRLGIQEGTGFFKCGSRAVVDWVTAFRVLSWDGRKWRVVLQERSLKRPPNGKCRWFDLDGLTTSALIIEARECAVDLGWTSWNLAKSAFVLEGEAVDSPLPTDSPLHIEGIELARCPRGVKVEHLPGEVRYRTSFFEVGFRLLRTGFTHLALDDEGRGRTTNNLLSKQSLFGPVFWAPHEFFPLRDNFIQGLRLHPVGGARLVGLHEHAVSGSVSVRANVVEYDVRVPGVAQRYRLRWEVRENRLLFRAERIGEWPLRAETSSAWHISLNSTVTPCVSLGRIIRRGEVGLMELPVLLHAPGQGTFRITNHESRVTNNESRITNNALPVLWRSDSWRPAFLTTAELKLGGQPQPEGDYLLPSGRHRAEIEFAVVQHRVRVRKGTSAAVLRALNRCSLTALTYRPDTATLTNNGNSIHAIICADCWSAVTTRLGKILPNLAANDLLRDTLERHLTGGPSYAAGLTLKDGKAHQLEDEYLMSGTAMLLGLANYLESSGAKRWLSQHRNSIVAELRRMRARDFDGDGLVESPHRLGVSGQRQWSTCWYDVISFGWKDAFANALLYPALRKLGPFFPGENLTAWADNLRANYWPTFFNPETGWFAGWRCKENWLHDYAFLFVNGAAVCGGLVEPKAARDIVERLWRELQRFGPLDFRLGLPGNLRILPPEELAAPMPDGVYMNRTLTHSQARHFVGALYKVGMTREADHVLHSLLSSLADATTFAGCGSGIDWRRRDGAPSGYEGLLSDQFGILGVALDRHGTCGKKR
jgi:hypothetical protein